MTSSSDPTPVLKGRSASSQISRWLAYLAGWTLFALFFISQDVVLERDEHRSVSPRLAIPGHGFWAAQHNDRVDPERRRRVAAREDSNDDDKPVPEA